MKQQNPGTGERQRASKSSQLLSHEENEQVFGLLGRKCQSMATAIGQIFKTEPSAHSHWKKKHTGVICFIKDSSKRSYFIRVYCLIKNELVWEHEIYDGIVITRARPYLITFEAQDGYVALNFASENECETFNRNVGLTIENRNRKRQERRSRPKSQIAPAAPVTNNVDTQEKVTLRNHPKISSIQITPNSNSTPVPVKTTFPVVNSKSNKKKKRYTKADISTPTNFVHISHVGWDAQKGFDLTGNEDDEMLKHFFNKAGVSEQELNDRATRAFIYDFVQSNNVLASVKSERVEKPKAPAPPPVPTRHQNQNGTQRTAPPPPPTRQPPPPLPTTTPPARGPPPSRPPPIATSLPTQAPPPPPPPMPVQPPLAPPPPPMPQIIVPEPEPKTATLPAVDDTRSALMDSIRKGITLKKVDQAALSTGSGDSRSDLMSEIRQGIELRPAQSRELSGSNRGSDSGGTDALADALRRALQERGRAIHSSDEDTDDSSENDGEWED